MPLKAPEIKFTTIYGSIYFISIIASSCRGGKKKEENKSLRSYCFYIFVKFISRNKVFSRSLIRDSL